MLQSVLNDISVLNTKRSSAAKRKIAIIHLSRVGLEALVVLFVLWFALHSRVESFNIIGQVESVIPTAHASEVKDDYDDSLLPLLETNIVSDAYDRDVAKMNEVRWAAKKASIAKKASERENIIADIELAKAATGRMMIVWNEKLGVKYSIYQKTEDTGYVRVNEELFEGGIYYHKTSNKDASYIVVSVSETGDEKNILGVKYNYYQ